MATETYIDENAHVQYTYEGSSLLGVLFLLGHETTAITIPTTQEFRMTEIGAFAFTEATGVTGVTLANSITTIRNKAFFNCKTLKNLTIGTGLAVLEEYAFAGCNNLESITGSGNGITAISNVLYSGSRAILGANGNITWRQDQTGVTEIGNRAFSFCDRITSLAIPATVTKIGDYAFSDCAGLGDVTIPSNVLEVGYGAFFGCSNVVDLNLEPLDSSTTELQSLGGRSFAGMEGLKIVHVFSKVGKIDTTIGEETFDSGGVKLYFDIQTPLSDNQYLINHVYGQCGVLRNEIPVKFVDGGEVIATVTVHVKDTLAVAMQSAKEIIEGKDEDLLGWYYNDGMTEEAKPTDIVKNYRIDGEGNVVPVEELFIYAKTKAHVEFSELYYTQITEEPKEGRDYGIVTLTGVKDWEELAQKGYPIPDILVDDTTQVEYRVTYLGPNLFVGGTLGAEMSIPWTVKRVGKNAFRNHAEVTAISFPDSDSGKKSQLATIDGQAFAGTGIETITIPNTLKTVRQGAFANCGSLDAVYADTMAHWLSISFGDSACNPLSNGGDLYLGNVKVTGLSAANLADATEIKPFAFAGCGSLGSVDFSGTEVATIGVEAFTANGSLASVTIGSGVTSIGRAAFSNSGVTSITVPNTVKGVGEFMFNGCGALTEVAVDTGVVSSSMFSNCGALKEVTIGANVTAIGKSAFAGSGNAYVRDTEDSQTGNWYYKLYGMEVSFAETGKCAIIDDYAFAKSGVVSADAEAPGEDEANPKGDVLALPSTLQRIGVSGFNGCGGLYKLALPDSLQSIGEHAFDNCPHLHTDNYYGYIALDGWILGTEG